MYLCLLSYCQNRKCGNSRFCFAENGSKLFQVRAARAARLFVRPIRTVKLLVSGAFTLTRNFFVWTHIYRRLLIVPFSFFLFFVWLLTVWRQDVKESGNWLLFDPVLLRRDHKTMLTSLFTFRLNAFRCLSWLWLARVKYLPSKRNKFFVPKSAYKPMHTCNFLRFIYPQLIALLNSNF